MTDGPYPDASSLAMDPDQLEDRVRAALGLGVAAVASRPWTYATTHAMHEVEVIFVDGTRRALLHKDLGTAHLLPEAQGRRPSLLGDPGCELHVYCSILARGVPGSPTCFAGEADADSGSWWLLLERVPGLELWQIGEHEVWCDVARWAAALHGLPDLADLAPDPPLVSYDHAFFWRWPDRARRFARDWEPSRRRHLEEVLDGYADVVDALAGLPRCFVHGELYPSNVLVDRAGGRVAAVDWEMAGIGPGVLDLSCLVSGGWSEDAREALVAAYHTALPEATRTSRGQLDTDLLRAELHRCVQWLGWAPQWEPPSEHRRDWLELARSLRMRLPG